MRATGRSRSRSLIEEALSATRETKTIELKEEFDPSERRSLCETLRDVLAMANSGGLVWPPISYQRWRSAPSTAHLPPQKLTVLDSEIKLANLIGSMKEAFKLLRSASVTPRATEQAPQTKTGTFPLITLSINSGRGGKPTP